MGDVIGASPHMIPAHEQQRREASFPGSGTGMHPQRSAQGENTGLTLTLSRLMVTITGCAGPLEDCPAFLRGKMTLKLFTLSLAGILSSSLSLTSRSQILAVTCTSTTSDLGRDFLGLVKISPGGCDSQTLLSLSLFATLNRIFFFATLSDVSDLDLTHFE